MEKGDIEDLVKKQVPRLLYRRYNATKHVITFYNGSNLFFCHVKTDADLLQYQGADFLFVGWEELTQKSRANRAALLPAAGHAPDERVDQHHSITDKMGDIFVQYDLPRPERANNRRVDGRRLCYMLLDTDGRPFRAKSRYSARSCRSRTTRRSTNATSDSVRGRDWRASHSRFRDAGGFINPCRVK
jgi:hypothetical protein